MFDELFDDMSIFVDYMRKNDSQSLRDRVLITDKLRYWYCYEVADLESIWSKITESEYAYKYCRWIRDRVEVWTKIPDSEWACMYCMYVVDRPEVRANIKE